MLVDHPGAARERLASDLADRGYDVVLAADGVDALAQSIARRVDVVIIDVALPGFPGAEAATVLKRLDPTVEVILTAGSDPVETGESAYVARFRCFTKPLDLDRVFGSDPEEDAP
jgi:DNA-binding NtrC family response regulator